MPETKRLSSFCPVAAIVQSLNCADRAYLLHWLTNEEVAPPDPVGGWTITLVLDSSNPDWEEYVGHRFVGHGFAIDLSCAEVDRLIFALEASGTP